jgi:D-arabinose 5-phosphate isomerase GutQ
MSETYILHQKAERIRPLQVLSGDGAITIRDGLVILSKGSAAAITITAPALTDNGKRLVIVTSTAQAHVITSATVGFNAKGSSGTATYTAAIGNSVTLEAYNGNWYTSVKTGVTIA